jgi:exosortase
LSSAFNPIRHPWSVFLGWILICSLAFWKPLFALVRYALTDENASHILIVPFLVALLLYLDRDRERICQGTFDPKTASMVATPAVVLAALVVFSGRGQSVELLSLILSFVLLVVAGFMAIFGVSCFRSDWFPFAMLGFLIPLPERLLNRLIYLLQAGSADVAEKIFDWTGVPALREGFVFHLPRLSIEVAQECSGIRSSIALFILALLVAHFSFSKFWKKAVFLIAGLLMMIVKNGVRIATLTILASYVNPDFLFGRLHREGGVVFFLIGLALLLPVYWLLRRGEATITVATSKTAASLS